MYQPTFNQGTTSEKKCTNNQHSIKAPLKNVPTTNIQWRHSITAQPLPTLNQGTQPLPTLNQGTASTNTQSGHSLWKMFSTTNTRSRHAKCPNDQQSINAGLFWVKAPFSKTTGIYLVIHEWYSGILDYNTARERNHCCHYFTNVKIHYHVVYFSHIFPQKFTPSHLRDTNLWITFFFFFLTLSLTKTQVLNACMQVHMHARTHTYTLTCINNGLCLSRSTRCNVCKCPRRLKL